MDLIRILDSTPEPPIVDVELTDINDTGEYVIATPVYEFQRELTDQIISLHYSDILKYCETNDKTELIVKSLEICIHNCTLVCSHPYLLITHYMPKNLLQRDMALKLAETSGKFNVLKDLINVICKSCEIIYGVPRQSNLNTPKKKAGANSTLPSGANANHKHIAIVLSNINKLVDLVEALLIGNVTRPFKLKRYVGNYLRRDHKKNEPSNANVTVHLISGDFKDMKQELVNIKFDFVFKLDELVPDDYVAQLRIQNRSNPCNLIKLIPILSIEHCKIVYQDQQQDPKYLYKLISSIVCLRDQIGILPPDIFPIYNQGLNYLMNFFTEALKNDVYPVWPLPSLAKLPNFTAIDVEKSLLTEVNFHYTPYDNDLNNESDDREGHKSSKTPKKSYYELNRLHLNYITNPLTNNFDKLLGIFNHNDDGKQVNYLTHRLLTQMNNLYMEYELVQQEYDIFTNYNTDSVQEKVGRRYLELNRTSSNIAGDLFHVNSRIEFGNKKFNKRTEEIEEMKEDIEKMNESIKEFASRDDVKDFNEKSKLVQNQLKIWELTTSIKDNITKIKSKQDEKNYMKTEYENSVKSIKESKETIVELKELNENLHKRYNTFKELNNEELKAFRIERSKLLAKIEKNKHESQQLKEKLTKSFRYLRDSSHLKKRKIRGITPK